MITDFEASYTGADGIDDSRPFMSADKCHRQLKVLQVLVGVAQSRDLHPYADLTHSRFVQVELEEFPVILSRNEGGCCGLHQFPFLDIACVISGLQANGM
ncbi:hypothetical protein [Rhodococcus sp. GOMB7]|uniref:hypothetical protein n=1 Tax=Rhodococcus sp. GOMB7 TaxID=2839033 RepID=UPI0027E2FD7A|nr:hypothetical protein [Rhodococcus sp. GOMB7]